jgi:D-alanyl-lipoteichoic acid acyltransferase DltB (MBOAT superfamily)
MLFNSPLFVLGFLPLTWGGFWLTASLAGQRPALGFLLAASLIFYGWWYPPFLLILLGSISVNFTVLRIMQTREHQKPWLIAGLCFNLGLLAVCKYTPLVSPLLNMSWHWALPLGISFFTFQQIMMLVDQSRSQAQAGSFLDYALFVAFFPHLIAGPIVRPGEIIPQLRALAPLDQWRSKLADGAETFSPWPRQKTGARR